MSLAVQGYGTENLTCRFIHLRKEHGKMFTGRKYSAQAGWEYILRQMKEEFPTIMADVHYRVLKKKWSNLLQQYKELKNPVHGDKNRADDISWPFYSAIDEVLGNLTLPQRRRRSTHHRIDPLTIDNSTGYVYNDEDDQEDDEAEDEDEMLDPQEFLSVSCAQYGDEDDGDEEEDEEETSYSEDRRLVNRRQPDVTDRIDYAGKEDVVNENEEDEQDRKPSIAGVHAAMPKLQPLIPQTSSHDQRRSSVFDGEIQGMRSGRRSGGLQQPQQQTTVSRKRSAQSSAEDELLSRLPRTTELTIRPIKRANTTATNSTGGISASQGASKDQYPVLVPISRASTTSANGSRNHTNADLTTRRSTPQLQQHYHHHQPGVSGYLERGSSLERKFDEFMEYSKRRDEENRSILLRMLKAMEDIRDSVR
ncbi:hypothetical protein QAD02_015898 [Eretmocerus hayati]|uniref:Uncharacterized protein n=1 Tax=Eretmocerus hayati TaxID=131215 RepID=A0ACC2PB94_9HYME|nr:hypothetical protein QAD02_015898 [Eretmocerus hayati]